MGDWHGYVVMEKPEVLTAGEWVTVLQALKQVLGRRDQSSMPAKRLHWRVSLNGRKVLLEGAFDLRDLDAEDLGRLCRYISEALDGKYTPAEVRSGLHEHVTVFGSGQRWRVSGAAARAAIAADRAEWEESE
jgi:hypothetical protein